MIQNEQHKTHSDNTHIPIAIFYVTIYYYTRLRFSLSPRHHRATIDHRSSKTKQRQHTCRNSERTHAAIGSIANCCDFTKNYRDWSKLFAPSCYRKLRKLPKSVLLSLSLFLMLRPWKNISSVFKQSCRQEVASKFHPEKIEFLCFWGEIAVKQVLQTQQQSNPPYLHFHSADATGPQYNNSCSKPLQHASTGALYVMMGRYISSISRRGFHSAHATVS